MSVVRTLQDSGNRSKIPGVIVLVGILIYGTAVISHRTGRRLGYEAGLREGMSQRQPTAREIRLAAINHVANLARYYPWARIVYRPIMCMGEVTAGECAVYDRDDDGYVHEADIEAWMIEKLDPKHIEGWLLSNATPAVMRNIDRDAP